MPITPATPAYAASTTGSGFTWTSGSFDIGAASSDRWIYVGVLVVRRNATQLPTVTIGGVSATAVGTTVSNGARDLAFFRANVQSGTTATVVLTDPASTTNAWWEVGVGVWIADGEPTLFDQGSDTTQSSGTLSTLVNVDTNGAVLAIMTCSAAGSNSWTGATEDFDTSSPTVFSGASEDQLSAQTGRTVSVATPQNFDFENALKVISLSPPAASGGLTADADFTLGALTVDGTAEVAIEATAAFDLDPLSVAADADVEVVANGAITFGALTVAGTITSYTLVAEPGSLVLTGASAALRANRRIAAEPGSLTISGGNAALRKGYILTASPGALTIGATDAALRVSRALVAQPGTIALTGGNALLLYSNAQLGTERTGFFTNGERKGQFGAASRVGFTTSNTRQGGWS